MKSLKAFRVYIFNSKVTTYVPSYSIKDILVQPDIDGRRGRWIEKILEFDLEINPTKLVKGQGLAKLLAESNYEALGISFINTCSQIQQVELPIQCSQEGVLLAECAWYRDILYFLRELNPPDGMCKSKARALKLKAVRYCLIGQVLYWRDPLGVLLRCMNPPEAQQVMFDFHIGLCGGRHF